jgi:hypothetical protein
LAGPLGREAEGVGVAEAQADKIKAKTNKVEYPILFFIWILQIKMESRLVQERVRWMTITNQCYISVRRY